MVLSSCEKDVIASAKWSWPEEQWIKGDLKTLTMVGTDTTTAYHIDLSIDHSVDYPFQNVYVRLLTVFPSGKEIKSITSLELANVDGSWSGDCGTKTCSLTLPLQKGFTFPEIGEYKLTIEPYMRVDTIDGLKSMTVVCRKLEE